MKIVTALSVGPNQAFEKLLRASCEAMKLSLIVLEYEGVFFSNRLKDALLSEYLETTDNEDIILFTDASDTRLLSCEDEILKKFHDFNSPLVFSAEINCWPDKKQEQRYPPSENHFRYLNTGGFIGKAGYIKSIYNAHPVFETHMDQFPWSNQYYWNEIFTSGEFPLIKIDHQCSIFYNTAIPLTDYDLFRRSIQNETEVSRLIFHERERLEKELQVNSKRLFSTITKSFPCHIHYPGPIFRKMAENNLMTDLFTIA